LAKTLPWLQGGDILGIQRQTLIAVLDGAIKRLLYAQIWPGETTAVVMSTLQAVFQIHGLPREHSRGRRIISGGSYGGGSNWDTIDHPDGWILGARPLRGPCEATPAPVTY